MIRAILLFEFYVRLEFETLVCWTIVNLSKPSAASRKGTNETQTKKQPSGQQIEWSWNIGKCDSIMKTIDESDCKLIVFQDFIKNMIHIIWILREIVSGYH